MPASRVSTASPGSSLTWMEKRLSHKPRSVRRAVRRPSGRCSTDSDHLMSTTVLCDASGAATVAAGLVAGKFRDVRRRTAGRPIQTLECRWELHLRSNRWPAVVRKDGLSFAYASDTHSSPAPESREWIPTQRASHWSDAHSASDLWRSSATGTSSRLIMRQTASNTSTRRNIPTIRSSLVTSRDIKCPATN